MKHIALVRSASSTVSKNSYNIQEIGLAKELAKMGMQVDVFLISDSGKTYSEKTGIEDRVTVYWLKGIKIPGQQGYYKDLKKILNKNKYDMIQALDDSQITTVLVSCYCKKHHIKFILWQGMYENYPEKYKRLIQYVFDWTLLKILRGNTNYCIAKTSSAKKYLEMKKFSNINVIPVGLEVANFKHRTEKTGIDYRKELNISKSRKIILYVGKVEERRKPFFCMDVYSSVKEKYEDCCLIYVGKGPMLSKVHEYVKQKKIRDVHFIDSIPQNELPNLYKESNLFILPTRYEIFGMVLMEAMYFGTPVITYRAAGPIDVIDNEVDGIVMDNFDSIQWANKIYLHLLQKDDFIIMGEKGKKKIVEEYLWPKVAYAYFDRYLEIIRN